ncbi:hypothetical protein N658DRAFT_500746 [Parathielavia hyrcaniae]|uniref:Uncharacterized protein n=1 Tax=Parathielavia hyrcaniae TaxID=113614 RepID=A0AAN6PUZ9_9PEZI|nr:hypothetical protein N658DRAFT_500746 [Parathielavia hyrcaniae]
MQLSRAPTRAQGEGHRGHHGPSPSHYPPPFPPSFPTDRPPPGDLSQRIARPHSGKTYIPPTWGSNPK